MDSGSTGKTRIAVGELLLLFGEQTTRRLILHCTGRRVPTNHQYLQAVRRMMVVQDWLHQGYSQRDLAAKYELSLSHVKRIITRHLRQQRRHAAHHAE
jgi:Mor family transcriptional regulator